MQKEFESSNEVDENGNEDVEEDDLVGLSSEDNAREFLPVGDVDVVFVDTL